MGTQRNRIFTYAPLDSSFSESNCTIDSIDLPNIQRASVVNISQAQDPGPLNYHTTERVEIVTFTVTYIPHDSAAGRKLLPDVQEVVTKVLDKSYEPAVAIIQLKRNGKVENETKINDCVIIQGDIVISDNNSVHITFTFQGILDSSY